MEVTSRDGRLIAGDLSFGRRPGDASLKTERPEPGIVVDFAADARPIGLEIASPNTVTLDAINRVLLGLGQEPATERELALLFSTRGGSAVAAGG